LWLKIKERENRAGLEMMHEDHCERCGGRVIQAGSSSYENLTTVSDNTASRSSIFVSSTTNARVPKKWNVAKIGDRNFCLQLSSCRSPSSPHLSSVCCSHGSICCLHVNYSSVRSKPERHGRLTNNDGVNICETGRYIGGWGCFAMTCFYVGVYVVYVRYVRNFNSLTVRIGPFAIVLIRSWS
jgi:hypothetical protein